MLDLMAEGERKFGNSGLKVCDETNTTDPNSSTSSMRRPLSLKSTAQGTFSHRMVTNRSFRSDHSQIICMAEPMSVRPDVSILGFF